MSKSLALAISVGVIAGLWTFLGSGYLSFASIAIGFIAWAASGLVGKSDAMQTTVIGMTFGAIIASVAVFLGSMELPLVGANGAVGVAIAALILVLVADRVSQVSNVGVNVLGFASAFSLSPNVSNITNMGISNPVVIVLASSILGVVAGILAGRLAASIK